MMRQRLQMYRRAGFPARSGALAGSGPCRRGYAKGSPRDFPCSLCDAKSTFFAPQEGLKGDKLFSAVCHVVLC